MFKKLLFTAFLACFALSANAQIATPQLDAGFHTYGGAAAGWRYGSTVNLTGISAEGKVELDGEEVGDVTTGLNAKGPEDSASPVPFLLAAYRGETVAAELYSNIGDGLKTDVEMENVDLGYGAPADSFNLFTEKKELRLNAAYVIGEAISIGVGYFSINEKERQEAEITAAATTSEVETETTETGTSLSASFRIADMFFVAAGMEMVSLTGTKTSDTTSPLGTDSSDQDFVENSWNNTMWGVGFISGEPEETQFRVEYGQISSPESEEEAESADEADSVHPQTTTSFASAEVKFNNFLLGVLNETEKQAEINDEEVEKVTTSIGLGWQPMEGLTASLYSVNHKKTTTTNDGEFEVNPTGYRFFIGYNF